MKILLFLVLNMKNVLRMRMNKMNFFVLQMKDVNIVYILVIIVQKGLIRLSAIVNILFYLNLIDLMKKLMYGM